MAEEVKCFKVKDIASNLGVDSATVSRTVAGFRQSGSVQKNSSICRFLKKMRFTRQKLKVIAKQRDDLLRAQFVSEVSLYEAPMLIFLDETGSDRRASIRWYGYSLRGQPLVSKKLLVRGKRISAMAFMSINGMLDCQTVTGTVDVKYSTILYRHLSSLISCHSMEQTPTALL